MPTIFAPIYVQFGKLKQKLRPWRTVADFGFIEGSPDDPLHLDDFGEAPDDSGLIVGLTVERLKREVKFGIPRSATAMRNDVALAENDLVVPGDVIEFVRRRASKKMLQQKAVGDDALAIDDEDRDHSKLVVSDNDLSAHYKGQPCFLGSTMSFALLKRFSNSPGIYISLDTLKEDVWGATSEIEDGGIRKQVSVLRGKLLKAGMDGITIDGKEKGRYRLLLT